MPTSSLADRKSQTAPAGGPLSTELGQGTRRGGDGVEVAYPDRSTTRRSPDAPLALVTASARRIADTVLATIGAARFAVTVAAEDTTRTKPHPDPYLLAMALLGVPADGCVAIEDTPTGVAAVLAAGCATVAVPSVVAIDPALGLLIIDSLVGTGIDLFDDILRPLAARTATK